jgi:methionyl-tRNA formyltransferase
MAGDEQTGICIMQMEAGLDTGPVLLRTVLDVETTETTGELHDRLSSIGASCVVRALSMLPTLSPEKQIDEGVTYAEKISKDEAKIDWAKPAIEIDRLIRGLSPFPGAWCDVNGERVKLLGSRLADGKGASGEVLNGFTIACGDSAVEITKAHRAGKKAMSAEEILKGLELGARLH